MKPLFSLSALAVCGLLTLQPALAQNGPPPGGGMPPQEAFTACQSATRGASCSMSTPQGTLAGTCGGPEGKPLACMPPMPSR